VAKRTARTYTASQLLESLEQRIVLDGFFAIGAMLGAEHVARGSDFL